MLGKIDLSNAQRVCDITNRKTGCGENSHIKVDFTDILGFTNVNPGDKEEQWN